MDELLKIGGIAKQGNLSKRTIRYYQEIGVLPPPARSKGGTKLYNQIEEDHHWYRNTRLFPTRTTLLYFTQRHFK